MATPLRDRVETVLRSWDGYEIARGAPPIVDFDCHPGPAVAPATDRLTVRAELVGLLAEADPEVGAEPEAAPEPRIAATLRAALAYLDALLGSRPPLERYVQLTQGCGTTGWDDAYVDAVAARAVAALADLGVAWDAQTVAALRAVEGPVAAADAADLIRAAAEEIEPDVRRFARTDAPFTLAVEHVDLDVYWAYWLDGAGDRVRMRINRRNASFTQVQARQFALHEVLGHGLQGASYAQACRERDVPWVRITSVHAPQQVLLEGLAQALPLFVRQADAPLVARVRLAHYLELVRARLHLAINADVPVADCVAMAGECVPFWSAAAIGDMLTDRGNNPLLRSYLWAYPAGIDWFVRLADEASPQVAATVVQAAYRDPLTPADLAALWPDGPPIGGG